MKTKTIDQVFIITGILLGIATTLSLVSCATWKDLDDTQIIDAQGNIVYTPPGEIKKIMQVPATGNPTVDYAVALVAATVYGALGFWIRKVKKNGTIAMDDVTKRLNAIEKRAEPVTIPTPRETIQISTSDLVDLLHQLNVQRQSPPTTDGTSQ